MGYNHRIYSQAIFRELESTNEDKLMALENIQANKAKVSKLYNKKAILKCFAESDLEWKVVLPTGTRTAKFSKWFPNWERYFIITQVMYCGTYKLATLDGDKLARSINDRYLKKYNPTMREVVNIKEKSIPQPQAN